VVAAAMASATAPLEIVTVFVLRHPPLETVHLFHRLCHPKNGAIQVAKKMLRASFAFYFLGVCIESSGFFLGSLIP